MKKKAAFLLALMILLSACSEGAAEGEAAGETSEETEAVVEETTAEKVDPRMLIDDELPEKDFGGRNFIVLGSGNDSFHKYVYTESLNGEVVNDSVFQRNLTLEERFNSKVMSYVPGTTRQEASAAVKTAVQAGDNETFQLCSFHVVESSGLLLQDYYLNWYEIDHINFDKPWWADSTVEDLSINDHCFLAVGDAAVSTISCTYCVFYDKDAAVIYNLENMYDVVKEGRWTVDYVKTVCESVAQDLDGDGAMTENDYYGYSTDFQSNVNTYLWAFGGGVYTRNADGEMEFTYYNEHLVNIYDKVFELLFNTQGVYGQTPHGTGTSMMALGKSLFANGVLHHTTSKLVDFDHEYGIIPYPKYDESQAEYRTMVDGSHEAMSIAKNAVDFEFIGIMTEAMCAESYKQIIPSYYDVCLKQRYASSPDDAEMIELCVDSRVFDFGYVYDNWQGVSFLLQSAVQAQNNNIASTFKSGQKVYKRYYDKVIEKFYPEG